MILLQRDVIEDAEGNYEPLRDQKGGMENPDIFWHFIKVGRSCTEKLAKNRPEMVQVLKAFDIFISQQNTQASSIRTVSSHVTGIPLLFETPNSRPASLNIPGGNSTTHRLSPEMRATSPFWMPQSQAQPGYQTPPTISTNQSIASNHVMVRRSPLPSPSTPSYPVPHQMVNHNGIGNGTPGLYNHHQQMINPFQPYDPVAAASPLALNIGGGTLLQAYNPNPPSATPQQSPSSSVLQNATRSRNPSQVNGIPELTNIPNTQHDNIAQAIPAASHGSPMPALSIDIVKLQQGHSPLPAASQPFQNARQANPSNFVAVAPPQTNITEPYNQDNDDFLPVFLLERKDEDTKEKVEQAEGTDDEEHSEWTRDEQEDGPATVIPLITELGIKDSKDQQ